MDTDQIVARRLHGRTAIITGGGSGMGLASVKRFLSEGASVVAVDLDGAAAEQAVAGHEESAFAEGADVTDVVAMQRVVEQTVERFGSLDCYFNNAGVPMVASPIEETSDQEWQRNIAVNLTAFFIAARIVAPIMKQQGSGVILVTSSMTGIRPRPNLSAYAAAKGGAVNLAKALAIELADFGIRVNAICPVATETPMLKQFGPGDHGTAKATPLGRLARADEIASTAAFLASDDASFITGSAILVDGGRNL